MTMSRKLQIAPGEDLVAALRKEAPGWVQANGALEAVTLRAVSDRGTVPRTASGRSTLVSLVGSANGVLTAIVCRAKDQSVEIFAGTVESARSGGVTVVVSPFEAAEEVAEVASPSPPPATSAEAQALATAAADAAAREEAENDAFPEENDLVDHFSLGICEVLTSDGDRLKIRDLHGQQRVREVSLDRLAVARPVMFEGKRLFRLAKR
jgi:hypothetical protein